MAASAIAKALPEHDRPGGPAPAAPLTSQWRRPIRGPKGKERHPRRLDTAACVLTIVASLVYVGSVLVRHAGYQSFLDGWFYNACLGLASLVCLATGWSRRRAPMSEMRMWTLFGIGSLVWTIGDVWWTIVVRPLKNAPYPSLSDYLWLSSYLFLVAGIVSFVFASWVHIRLSIMLDAAICALACGAVAAGFAFGTILKASSGSGGAVATNLSYPVLDLVLFVLTVTALGLRGWHVDLRTVLLAAAFVVFGATDTFYLLRVAANTYVQGTILDTGWLVAFTLIAVASRCTSRPVPPTGHSWGLVTLPVGASAVSLSLLVYAAVVDLNPLAVGLAAAGLTLAGIRMAVTFREVVSLYGVKEQAYTDELTGVGNRRRLVDHLDNKAEADDGFAVLAIDLDRFKDVNDTFGHPAGDEVLRFVAGRVSSNLRDSDLLTRIGGDEFTVVLGRQNLDDATGIALRLLESLRSPFVLSFGTVAIDASIGIAVWPDHGGSADELLRRADEAMYTAKRDGTGVEIYRPGASEPNEGERRLLQQLRHHGLDGQLVLYFQPKVELATGAIHGAEALVRWNHPERGILLPAEFLPLCEGTGLMRRISQWVIDAALQQTSKWLAAGHHVPVAINISAADLEDAALAEFTASTLSRYNVPASLITFEITETTLISHPARAAEVIRHLGVLGVEVSLDDFGTGFSSLSHLTDFALSELKLDRRFVSDLANPSAEIVVRSITNLAHALGLRVVAEGIEDPELASRLRAIGCDVGQGFLWSRAVPAAEFIDFLTSTRDLNLTGHCAPASAASRSAR